MSNTDFPTSVIAFMQMQLSMFGRTGAADIVRVPELTAPVAAGTTQDAPALQWTEPGSVIALYAQELTGQIDKFAQTEFRLQFGGQTDFVTAGRAGGTFAPLLGLVGPNVNWFPMMRRCDRGVPWNVSWKNTSNTDSTPTMLFAVLYDSKIGIVADMMKAMGLKV